MTGRRRRPARAHRRSPLDPRLLNIRDLPKIGVWPADIRRIDRRSPFGNPFRIGAIYTLPSGDRRLDRETALALYRIDLTRKLVADPTFLEPLRGHRLACWCTPERCHGEIILEELDRTGS